MRSWNEYSRHVFYNIYESVRYVSGELERYSHTFRQSRGWDETVSDIWSESEKVVVFTHISVPR